MRRKRLARSLLSTLVALAGAIAAGGVAFGVQMALAQPPASTKLGANIVRAIRQNRAVYSAGWLGGRRVGAVCKTIGALNERYSQVALTGGREGIVAWRSGRMFHRAPHHLGQLRNEVLLAGCSGQLDRLVTRQIRLATDAGRPLRFAPAIVDGRRALRLRVDGPPRLTYVFFDPEKLVPVAVALRTPLVSGTSKLDAQPWVHVHRHQPWLH